MRTLLRAAVASAALAFAGCASAGAGKGQAEAAGSPAAPPPVSQEAVWGIKPVALRPTMDGRMLDFRYQVVDSDKAKPLFDRKLKPYLYDQQTGVALGMQEGTKLGALRASVRNPPVNGKQYYVIFANTLGRVKKGSRVTVVIGDCRMKDVVVE